MESLLSLESELTDDDFWAKVLQDPRRFLRSLNLIFNAFIIGPLPLYQI